MTTDPQSSKIKELFTAPLHDMSELLTSSVHQLDQPPPPLPGMGPPGPVSSRLSSRDVSTRLSNNTQMPPLEPHPQHAASRQSNRVSLVFTGYRNEWVVLATKTTNIELLSNNIVLKFVH